MNFLALAERSLPVVTSMLMPSKGALLSLLVLGIGFKLLHNPIPATTAVTLTGEGPLDEFLNSLSDEEAAQLQYYEIEEIPEY